MAKHDVADLLALCLDDLKDGRRSTAECLEAHPEARGDLEPLLLLAQRLTPPPVEIDPVRKVQARYRFVEALHQERRRPLPWWRRLGQAFQPSRGWRMAPTTAALVLALTVATGGGATFAAQGAQPDEPLYGLKMAVEQVQVAVALTDDGRAGVHLQIADRRLEEVSRAIRADNEGAAARAAEGFESTMSEARQRLARAQEEGKDVSPLVTRLASTQEQEVQLVRLATARGMGRVRDTLDPDRRHLPEPAPEQVARDTRGQGGEQGRAAGAETVETDRGQGRSAEGTAGPRKPEPTRDEAGDRSGPSEAGQPEDANRGQSPRDARGQAEGGDRGRPETERHDQTREPDQGSEDRDQGRQEKPEASPSEDHQGQGRGEAERPTQEQAGDGRRGPEDRAERESGRGGQGQENASGRGEGSAEEGRDRQETEDGGLVQDGGGEDGEKATRDESDRREEDDRAAVAGTPTPSAARATPTPRRDDSSLGSSEDQRSPTRVSVKPTPAPTRTASPTRTRVEPTREARPSQPPSDSEAERPRAEPRDDKK